MTTFQHSCLRKWARLLSPIGRVFVPYDIERNHRGLGNRLLTANDTMAGTAGAVRERERIGGLLNYYYRESA